METIKILLEAYTFTAIIAINIVFLIIGSLIGECNSEKKERKYHE